LQKKKKKTSIQKRYATVCHHKKYEVIVYMQLVL